MKTTTTREIMSMEDIENEIARLLNSEAVKLAKKESQVRNRRRNYMYTLRCMERRGRQLMAEGVTINDLEELIHGSDYADEFEEV